MRLYFVTTGPPGPGVRALIDEAEVEYLGGAEVTDPFALLRAKLAERPPCEFIEVEDVEGRGARSGAEWEARPGGGGWRLGPFLPVDKAMPTEERLWTLGGRAGGLEVYADGPERVLDAGPMFSVYARSDEEFDALIEVLGGVEAARIGSDCAFVRGDDLGGGLRVLLYPPPTAPRPENAAMVRLREAKQRLAEERAERSDEEE